MANKEMTATEKMRQKFADKALDTEQLDGVAGGSIDENNVDLDFLRELLNDPLPNTTLYDPIYHHHGQLVAARGGWAKVGVTLKGNSGRENNRYFIYGNLVSRDYAMEYAKRVVAQRNKK